MNLREKVEKALTTANLAAGGALAPRAMAGMTDSDRVKLAWITRKLKMARLGQAVVSRQGKAQRLFSSNVPKQYTGSANRVQAFDQDAADRAVRQGEGELNTLRTKLRV